MNIFKKRVYDVAEDGMKSESTKILCHIVSVRLKEAVNNFGGRRIMLLSCNIKWRLSIYVHCKHVGVVLFNQFAYCFNEARRPRSVVQCGFLLIVPGF